MTLRPGRSSPVSSSLVFPGPVCSSGADVLDPSGVDSSSVDSSSPVNYSGVDSSSVDSSSPVNYSGVDSSGVNKTRRKKQKSQKQRMQQVLRIGFDLDGVICDYYSELVKNLQEEVDPEITIEDLKQYNLGELFGWTKGEAEDFFNRDYERKTFLRIKPNENAIELISELYSKGHEIYIITSRNLIHAEHTAEWIVEHNLPHTCLMFCKNKVPAAEKLGIDLFIDDDPAQLRGMKQAGIDCIVYDVPVNREYNDAKRVFSWNDIMDYIESKAESKAAMTHKAVMTQKQKKPG